MPGYHVIIQPEAEQDLDEAYQYLEGQRTGLGFELLADLTEIVELLEDNPFLFPTIYGEKRRAVIQRFRYNLIFKIVEEKVFILAIIHGSRDTQRWEGRK